MEELKRRVTDLTLAAEGIIESINSLNEETGGQLMVLAGRTKRDRMMIWGLIVSLALDVILTVFMVHLTVRVNDAQEVTRSQVLCPLYQQFINSDTPKTRELAMRNGQDMKARDEAFGVIHHSYNLLRCADKR